MLFQVGDSEANGSEAGALKSLTVYCKFWVFCPVNISNTPGMTLVLFLGFKDVLILIARSPNSFDPDVTSLLSVRAIEYTWPTGLYPPSEMAVPQIWRRIAVPEPIAEVDSS